MIDSLDAELEKEEVKRTSQFSRPRELPDIDMKEFLGGFNGYNIPVYNTFERINKNLFKYIKCYIILELILNLMAIPYVRGYFFVTCIVYLLFLLDADFILRYVIPEYLYYALFIVNCIVTLMFFDLVCWLLVFLSLGLTLVHAILRRNDRVPEIDI